MLILYSFQTSVLSLVCFFSLLPFWSFAQTPDITQPASQSVCYNGPTSAVSFTGSVPGTVYTWVNDNPSIGLPASGTGNIASFAAVNPGVGAAVASVTVMPSLSKQVQTFSNAAEINIENIGAATTYPSTIAVTGLTGIVTKVTITLKGLSHTFPADIDMLLVGPNGQNAVIMSDAGSSTDVINTTLTLDDSAPNVLTPGITGTYQPVNLPNSTNTPDSFESPAPAAGSNSALSVFNGTDPNGTWSLYIVDDLAGDQGTLAEGWEITITTKGVTPPPPALPVQTYANTAPVTIPNVGTGGLYPSTIAVSGLTDLITKVTVTIKDLTHYFPADIDMLLVGPNGQNAVIMSDVGASTDAVNTTLTFDDTASDILTPSISGTYSPMNNGTLDTFDSPAPASGGTAGLSVFNGTDPNGTWSLYVVDDLAGDQGSIAGGWEIAITTGGSFTGTAKTFTITVNPSSVLSSQIIRLDADEAGCPVRLTGLASGNNFAFTGPGGYVHSSVYRNPGTYELVGLQVKQPGQYTLTSSGYSTECGSYTPVSKTVNVTRACP